MENFFYDDRFYEDISEFIEWNDLSKEEVSQLCNEWHYDFYPAELQPIFKLNADWITERIEDERLPEDSEDRIINRITSLLNEVIDFNIINDRMPKAWYEKYPRKATRISRDEMIKHIEDLNPQP